MASDHPKPEHLLLKAPKNFIPDALIAEFGHPTEELKGKPYQHRDRLYYLIHLMSRHYQDGKHPDTYINTCSEALKNVFRSYKTYLNYLTEHGVIESDDSYSNFKGYEKCKGYRLTIPYRESPIMRVIIFDEDIVRKIEKNKARKTQEAREKYPQLCDQFDLLDVDEKEAKAILDNLYKDTEEDIMNRAQQQNLLNKVQNKTGSFKVGRTGRLYNPISNLRKELRPALRVNGEKLVELDIKASIPTILEILLSREGAKRFDKKIRKYSNYRKLKGGNNEKKTQQGLGRGQQGNKETRRNLNRASKDNPYMWANFGGLLTEPDVIQFREDISKDDNDIYDIYTEKFNEVFDKEIERGDAKKIVLSIINSPKYCESGHKDLLQTMYPNVIEIIDKINGYFKISQNGVINDDVAPIAYITQEIESDFVLGIVCSKIVEQYPDIPIYTIHDAIYTTNEFADNVHDIILEEAKAFYGVDISVKKKPL